MTQRIEQLRRVVAIAVGGAIGATARWLVDEAFATGSGGFPWGTFVANITGAFALGYLVVILVERFDAGPEARGLLLVGVLGSFTTFSRYAMDGVALIDDGEASIAVAYWAATLVFGLAAGVGGLRLARR